MARVLKNYIGGAWVESQSTQKELVVNPATEEVLAELRLSTKEECVQAIEVAEEAFHQWKKMSIPARARHLFALHHLLLESKEELARLITMESGKALSEARGEVQRGIENVENAASITSLIMGDSLSTAATHVEITNYRYPIGVIGAITPFNFPMMVPFWTFPMALAAGNSIVIKPSEKTPLLMEKIVELVEKSGFPAGVFNVVFGAHDVVNTLLSHPLVKGISFVGSKGVGEYVYREGCKNLKRVQALAGAKNHVIVLKDANIERAVRDIIGGGFGSAGQRCMAAAVVVLEESIAEQFINKFIEAAKAIKMGNGLDDGVFLGPVIRKEAQERTFNYIQKGVDEGAKLLLDGRKNIPAKGYFVGPTIFDGVTPEMTIWKEEIFAPVVTIMRVKNMQQAIEITNQSEFANGSCLFTNNAAAIRYFRENVDAGMLGINLGVPAPMAWFAFSGWKSSFFGDLHANGKDSVEFYTRRKVVTARYDESEI
ncbi:CoA-acylating methylmalonate-semialdehyde dehydrogenase (plasmid) [Entomospira entomophila]|uniref:methylmalonate-semialdehyde dehydrogenase (CoA acylating) n=1 Tax=Entomospira entomophila TaxID=2719988 RepID=A0A968GF34_9SPIO|nr:CoA-acylating methylmalonate-semialdehyde dehydrogenase [Entomospira entomophilus]NIZ41284.1 CoA-acylating methylmalonate-semialdehyde dehydrogenase [Entomospira entomophilus]WDI36189.1 CoA-acylating methylmalonate-semialdehyde dehydrogenase [Entomospira entomophilus]